MEQRMPAKTGNVPAGACKVWAARFTLTVDAERRSAFSLGGGHFWCRTHARSPEAQHLSQDQDEEQDDDDGSGGEIDDRTVAIEQVGFTLQFAGFLA